MVFWLSRWSDQRGKLDPGARFKATRPHVALSARPWASAHVHVPCLASAASSSGGPATAHVPRKALELSRPGDLGFPAPRLGGFGQGGDPVRVTARAAGPSDWSVSVTWIYRTLMTQRQRAWGTLRAGLPGFTLRLGGKGGSLLRCTRLEKNIETQMSQHTSAVEIWKYLSLY